MSLWSLWLSLATPLTESCRRQRTRLWFMTTLIAFSIRGETVGVTSFVRALGLREYCYDRILDFLNSSSLCIDSLTNYWVALVFARFPLVRINNRPALVADGLKRPKTGKKIPAVKKLHQESGNNNKPEYIFGHSLQAVGILVNGLKTVFSVPLAGRIHEGLRLCRKDRSTLMDRMIGLLARLALPEPCYLIADAYYSNAPIMRGLLKGGHHLISRVRSNAVAYRPVTNDGKRKGRGRRRKYGRKVKLKNLFLTKTHFVKLECMFYGKRATVAVRTVDLVLRRVGLMVRFVLVKHPVRGNVILVTTDLTLTALQIVEAYSLRFKIEVSFKQSIHTIGAYVYHFWSKAMKPRKGKSGDQDISAESVEYQAEMLLKVDTCHRYIQIGLIAQGLLQYLACTAAKQVWMAGTTYLRTKNTDSSPSEGVVRDCLRDSFPEFIVDSAGDRKLTDFIRSHLCPKRKRFFRIAA